MAKKVAERMVATLIEDDDLHLIYKIEGSPHEVDIFDLARALESLGQVVQEGARVVHPEITLSLKVAPFQPGSFIADIAMFVHQNPQAGGLHQLLSKGVFRYVLSTDMHGRYKVRSGRFTDSIVGTVPLRQYSG
jgi:hypothetical protein